MTETLEYGWGVVVKHYDNMNSAVIDNGKTKKFRGEYAWSNAERYAYDLTVSRQYA